MNAVRKAGWCAAAVLLTCLGSTAGAEDGPAKGGAPAPEATPAATPSPAASPAAAAAAPAPAPAPTVLPSLVSDWKFAGDFRVRYERTTYQQPTSVPAVLDPRNREVVRFRAGATKSFGKLVNFGVRMRTGSADDPNSTDITISDFNDSLEVSLDRAYFDFRYKGAFLTAGKFVNPFVTTELVWDGDVHLQGAASSLETTGTGKLKARAVGVYYMVDEQTANPDSSMAGGQAQLLFKPSGALSAMLAGGYYDYTIRSLVNADTGDTRTNRLAAGGRSYLSDYDLLNGVVMIDHKGFGKKYPVRLVADYVKNLGADDRDTGFGVDFFVGRASDKGDKRFRYGYSQAETDAVLAAFSHDNTSLATNYKQHSFTADWQLRKDLQLNATWYLYKKLDVPSTESNPWVNRLRLNALVAF